MKYQACVYNHDQLDGLMMMVDEGGVNTGVLITADGDLMTTHQLSEGLPISGDSTNELLVTSDRILLALSDGRRVFDINGDGAVIRFTNSMITDSTK